MKKLLKIITIFTLAFTLFSLPKSVFAEEVQYTDNIIPVMTSNTSPSGEASASSTYCDEDNNYSSAWLAFDHEGTLSINGWVSNNDKTGWLAYEFTDSKCITKYTIVSNGHHNTTGLNGAPRYWTFEGWDEQSSKWVILDIRKNITDWYLGVKKEFTFLNTNAYKKYRINVTSTKNDGYHVCINELEMMETVYTPTNLTATAGDSNVQLSWSAVNDATGYNVKRSLTSGGPYETIASTVSGSAITYADTDVFPGTTYYYVVSAIVSGKEGTNSNEASATLTDVPTFNGNAILDIYLDDGTLKEYNLTGDELSDFLTWYDANGEGKAYYTFTVKGSVVPFKGIKNYIPYNKILYFDVKEYDE